METIDKKTAAMKQALEALEICKPEHPNHTPSRRIYTSPSARKPLTDVQIEEAFFTTKTEISNGVGNFRDGVRFAEAAHGIK
jgi:hypothetical protein